MKMLGNILLGIGVFYGAVLLLLWLFQAKLFYPAPQDRPEPPPGFAEVILTAQDGIKTRALYKPASLGKPTVIYWHGNGDSLLGSLAGNRLLEAEGYGVMLPEYRGYGGNEGNPSEFGFYQDGRAAIAFLQSEGIAAGELIISGYSIGSGTAVQMATEHRPAALLLNAPFRSLTDIAADAVPWAPVRWLIRDRFDNEGKIGALTMPILITHGAADTLIPPANGQALYRAAKDAEFLLFEGLGHNQMNADAVVIAQRDWLAQRGL